MDVDTVKSEITIEKMNDRNSRGQSISCNDDVVIVLRYSDTY